MQLNNASDASGVFVLELFMMHRAVKKEEEKKNRTFMSINYKFSSALYASLSYQPILQEFLEHSHGNVMGEFASHVKGHFAL